MRAGRSLVANLALLLASVLVFTLVLELGLRVSGFTYRLYPETVEFGQPDPVMLETGFREDPDVFWVTPGYDEKLARLRRERPRLILMGDSCTHLGRYDEALARLVAERLGPARALSFGNLGVAGWSSYQGLAQLRRDVVPLLPRAVSVYYGWNDHWIGFGIEDKEVARVKRGVPLRGLERLRLVQLATRARVVLRSREAAYPERVSLDDFAANLRAIVATAHAHGIEPILITAPTSHRQGEEPEVLTTRWLRRKSDLVPLHRAYTETVRAVAEETGATLCDAAADFEGRPREALEALMKADGIHPSPAGDRRLAELLYGCLEAAGVLDEVAVPAP